MSSSSLSEIGVTLIDNENPESGLMLEFTGGDSCNETNNYALTVQLNCDQYAKKTTYELDTSSLMNPCTPKVILTSKEACPVLSLGTLWHFFNTYYYLFGAVMITLGAFLMIFGGQYYKFTMFAAGQITVAAFIMIIMFAVVYP